MRRDPVFSQLDQALDARVAGQAMQKALFGESGTQTQVEACRVDEVRYKPAKYCVLSYQLTLRDHDTPSTYAQVVSGRLRRAGELRPTGRAGARQSPATAFVPELAMDVWLFPADRKLQHLMRLFDAEWLARHLPVTLKPLGFARRDQLANLRVDQVHYIPERSCMVRCEMDWLPATSQQTARLTLFAKQYADDGGATAFSVMSQLRSQWPYGAHALRYDRETRTLWQQHLPGSTLTWERMLAADWGVILDRVADCVASLHQSAVRCERSFGVRHICKQLEETTWLTRELDTPVAAQTQALVWRLVSQVDALAAQSVSVVPLHRDLKLINFLWDEGQSCVRLIDLDCVALGDPAIDVGSLAGNLYLNGLRAGTDRHVIERVTARLIAAYTRRLFVSRRRLHWHIAAAMIYEVVRRSMRQRSAERLRHIDAYLRISKRYCLLMESVDLPD